MLRITGYSDRYSLCPGEEIKFYVNSEKGESYHADIVRMIHGDTNPEGPGFKVEELETPVSKDYPGRNQIIHGGSYGMVPHDHRMNVESFTLQAFIFPTTPDKGVQGVLTKSEGKTGYGLFIDENANLALWIGDDKGNVEKITSGKPLLRKVWYLAAASYDAATGKVCLYQEPVVTSANGGLGMSLLHPMEETASVVNGKSTVAPGDNDAPLLMAARTVVANSGRTIFGGHFKEAREPVELPQQADVYNGKIDRPRLSGRALDKSEIDALARGLKTCPASLRQSVIGAWDFHANITKNIASTQIIDTSPNVLHGYIINMPARGMTGYNWTGDEIVYHHAPQEYGAIHFHDDDVDAGIDGGPDRPGKHVIVGERGDDAVGAGGCGLLDDAGHVGEVAGGRIAVLDFHAHLLTGERDAVLDGVPPAVTVGRVADEHVAFAFGGCRGGAQHRRREHRNGQSELLGQ